jgi:hypothetical protein
MRAYLEACTDAVKAKRAEVERIEGAEKAAVQQARLRAEKGRQERRSRFISAGLWPSAVEGIN